MVSELLLITMHFPGWNINETNPMLTCWNVHSLAVQLINQLYGNHIVRPTQKDRKRSPQNVVQSMHWFHTMPFLVLHSYSHQQWVGRVQRVANQNALSRLKHHSNIPSIWFSPVEKFIDTQVNTSLIYCEFYRKARKADCNALSTQHINSVPHYSCPQDELVWKILKVDGWSL